MKLNPPKLISVVVAAGLFSSASIAMAGHGKMPMGGMSGMSNMQDSSSGMTSSESDASSSMSGMSEMMKNMSDMMKMMGEMPRRTGGMDRQGFHGAAHVGDITKFDTDENGDISPKELELGLTEELNSFDADKSGSLSRAEFETLHAARIRHAMVDHFQHLDEDGDGEISQNEMKAPAKMMMRRRHSATDHSPDPE